MPYLCKVKIGNKTQRHWSLLCLWKIIGIVSGQMRHPTTLMQL